MVLRPLKQTGKVKKLSKWVPHELTTNQKIILKCHLLLILCNNKPFLHQIVTFDEKWIVYNTCWWPTQLLDQEEAPKHFPKPNSASKRKRSWSLVVCCWSDPLQLFNSWQNHYIWEVCSANWWDAPETATPTAGIGQQYWLNFPPQQQPNTCRTINASKVEQIGLRSFCLICHIHLTSHQLITTSSRILTTLQGKHFHNQQEAENAFQEFAKSQSVDFYATGIKKTYFSLAKMCWL